MEASGFSFEWIGTAYAAIAALVGWIWRLWVKQGSDKEALLSKVSSLELKLAGEYHGKEELEKILDLKIGPVLKMLENIERRLNNGEGRGHARA